MDEQRSLRPKGSPLTAAAPRRTIAAASGNLEVIMGTEAVLGLVVPPLLAAGFVVGLQLISRFEEASEQADEARQKERAVMGNKRRHGARR